MPPRTRARASRPRRVGAAGEVDRWLNFRDAWNAFEYERGVTVWSKPFAKTWPRAEALTRIAIRSARR